ncbi:PAS domain S-box-containing protein [Chryseolinea serpens]|uniref:PAS domain S-box-containing protein n=1 Tax=Chryseolinea serpens TaxID=947013 RepID=A0A1M5R601_9BACT|nr:sigma 54-interacting transcriptional regulator [Chryseolinea serpens]SHH21638.1 PAS domain S-box-containing protein [Chryseolinea serpens]
MEVFYTSFGLVTAGVSLAMGSIYLFLAIKKGERTYLYFGLMGIALVFFFLTPPVGFILLDVPPYPANILVKRIFIFSYYALTPWFILGYSQYPRKGLAYAIGIIALACYAVMYLTTDSAAKPAWALLSVLAFGCTLTLGILAARWQFMNGQKKRAYPLAVVMTIYGLLFLLVILNQLTPVLNLQLFFPMHFHALLFMLIMGQRLASGLLEKYALEQSLRLSEGKWHSFMQHATFMIVEQDREGRITFVNDYGVNLLGYSNASDVLKLNWFDKFLSPADGNYMRNLVREAHHSTGTLPVVKTPIQAKDGQELVIAWSNFPITDAQGVVQTVMSIGRDITEEEKASALVEKLKNELLKEQIMLSRQPPMENHGLVGESKGLGYAIQKAEQVATTLAPVLLEGETGVGKELFASLIHNDSLRSDKPFVKVNCGALPKELIEDELFGHEKGAFTSASQSRKGRFELADGGTIFLDEIGELPLDMQPKLLRVLQSGEFERIGGQKTIRVDVRILAATNRNLSFEVQQGNFRSDLYYRLNVFPITIPPLRNRKEDLPLLIRHFMDQNCKTYHRELEQISRANLERLLAYDWPGNIRELRNVIERSVIVSQGKTLQLDWWVEENAGKLPAGDHSLGHVERDHIIAVMERCHWKINGENGAAEILAMHPNTLRSKMKKLDIKRPGLSEDIETSPDDLQRRGPL